MRALGIGFAASGLRICRHLGLIVESSGFEVQGLGFKVEGLGLLQGLGPRLYDLVLRSLQG